MRRITLAALVLFALTSAAALAFDGEMAMTWDTLDGGGGVSTGSGFRLAGTIGQPDAGGPVAADGFRLAGGYRPAPVEGPPPPCHGNTDGDGVVGFADLLAVLSNWGACVECAEDLDGDGVVAFVDLLIVLSNWGPCP